MKNVSPPFVQAITTRISAALRPNALSLLAKIKPDVKIDAWCGVLNAYST